MTLSGLGCSKEDSYFGEEEDGCYLWEKGVLCSPNKEIPS